MVEHFTSVEDLWWRAVDRTRFIRRWTNDETESRPRGVSATRRTIPAQNDQHNGVTPGSGMHWHSSIPVLHSHDRNNQFLRRWFARSRTSPPDPAKVLTINFGGKADVSDQQLKSTRHHLLRRDEEVWTCPTFYVGGWIDTKGLIMMLGQFEFLPSSFVEKTGSRLGSVLAKWERIAGAVRWTLGTACALVDRMYWWIDGLVYPESVPPSTYTYYLSTLQGLWLTDLSVVGKVIVGIY